MQPLDAGAEYSLVGPETVAATDRAIQALRHADVAQAADSARLWEFMQLGAIVAAIVVTGVAVVAVLAYRRTRSNSAEIGQLTDDLKSLAQTVTDHELRTTQVIEEQAAQTADLRLAVDDTRAAGEMLLAAGTKLDNSADMVHGLIAQLQTVGKANASA